MNGKLQSHGCKQAGSEETTTLTFGLSDGVADFGLDVVHAVVREDQGQTNTHTQTHKKKIKQKYMKSD